MVDHYRCAAIGQYLRIRKAAIFGVVLAASIFLVANNAFATSNVASISPTSGPQAGGTFVTVTGTFTCTGVFSNVQVNFGGVLLTGTRVNNTTVTVTSPAGTGTVDIVVTVNCSVGPGGGTSGINAGDKFTYTAPAQAATTPTDSLNLRATEIAVTQQAAAISGQMITGALANAIEDAFACNDHEDRLCERRRLRPNGNGFTLSFAGGGLPDPPAISGVDNVKAFVASPDGKQRQQVDDEFAALAYARAITKAPPKPAIQSHDWLAWLDVRGMSFNNNNGVADLRGNQVGIATGVSRTLGSNFLIGAVAGYEYINYDSNGLNSRLKGDGWNTGAYLAWHVSSSIIFDTALVHTAISYSDTSGAASGSFPGSRWLASGGLTGTYFWQEYIVHPSARLYALWERDSAFIDTLGTAQPDNNFSTARGSLGAKVSHPYVWTQTISLAPYVGAYSDYYFSSTSPAGGGVVTPPLLLQGWSARVTSGLDLKFAGGGMLSFGGELGGIGSNTRATIWSYQARGSIPF